MTDNKTVQVALRIRPLVPSELNRGSKNIIDVFQDLNQVRIRAPEKAFTYNYVFGGDSEQGSIYDNCVEPMIANLFNGYNLTILAYGQTGSGKTFTMGTTYNGQGEMGVIPRVVTDIFTRVKDNFLYDFKVTVSFMEIYQEVLYDLLSNKSRDECVLDIREDNLKGVRTPGLTELPVTCVIEVLNALVQGSNGRATGSTNMNSQSSRSHAIFTINIRMIHKVNSDEKTAKFHLVDLAGSERPKKTGAVGNTFKEGVNINKGLLVLGNVISALGDDKHQYSYIPYRDSNLTRLLKDSLGGNSITLMIACVSPADYNVEETLSTLRYADRARKIQNKPIVNQDPKAVEINKLHKTIHELKLQIVGQGGPAMCSSKVKDLQDENELLHAKIRNLTMQLSNTLTDNTGLLEKLIILQNANDALHGKICDLKNDYNNTLNDFNNSLDHMDNEIIKKNIIKLQQIQNQFIEIDSEQKKTEKEMQNHEKTLDLQNSRNRSSSESSDLISKDQENFTNQQVALNNQLQQVNKDLAVKENLAKQIYTNTQLLVDYQGMAENEARMQALEKEKNELSQQLKGQSGATAKLCEQRRKRVQELESQIQDLNRKVQEQARLIKMKEKDMIKVKILNNEILQMKQTRVKLIKKMREESEKFRVWKTQRERELAQLKQQDRKKQNQIIKMEAMHSKQQNVLKRKVEEAAALNKRLKDALSLRKANHEIRSERIGHWIKQELDVYVHLVEAEATLLGLLEDRGTLQEQLNTLKQDPEENATQIASIEEDLELRSAQIQDFNQKILDSKDENKTSKLDNIQTMAESKHALKLALDQITDLVKQHLIVKTKLLDTQANFNEIEQKNQELEKTQKTLENKHVKELSNVQKENENKVAVLLRQLRGVELGDASEELQQRCAIQSEKIDELEKQNEDLVNDLQKVKQENLDLHDKLNIITTMAAQQNNDNFQTPPNVTRIGRRVEKDNTLTFTVALEENGDASFEEVDDCLKDPSWRNTPMGKWLMKKKSRSTQKLSTNDTTQVVNLKRSSDGGCTCQRSNCAGRCGCRKLGRSCSSGCKCSSDYCQNRRGIENEDTDIELGEKKPRLEKSLVFNSSEDWK